MNGEAWGIADAAAFVAAIDKELADTAAENVQLVRKGRMTQPESDYVVGLLRDIRSDLAHAFGPLDPIHGWQRPSPAVRWRDKVQWIRRELGDRRDRYPDLVAKGRITEEDARTRTRIVGALHRLYWQQLFMWEPDAPAAVAYLARLRETKGDSSAELLALRSSEGAKIYRELVRKHLATIEDEQQEKQGRLVA